MFWEKVFELIKIKFGITSLRVNVLNILLNEIHECKTHVTNFICLLAKQYIYSQKCLGKELNIIDFKNRVYQIQNIEKYIATKNDKLQYHDRKWRTLEEDRGSIHSYVRAYFEL